MFEKINDHLFQLVQFLHQAFVALAGQLGLNDADMAGLDSTKTATGVRQLTNEKNETFRPLIGDVRPGVQDLVKKAARLIDQNLDEGEVRKFLEDDIESLETYLAIRTQDFEYDVDIVLTKYQQEQELDQLMSGIAACKDYVAQLPEVRQALGRLYIRQLELLQETQAKEIIEALAAIPPMLSPDLQQPSSPKSSAPQPAIEPI